MITISEKAKILCEMQQKIDELFNTSNQLSADMEFAQEQHLKALHQMSNKQKEIINSIAAIQEAMNNICKV